ncbi:hypothetical protein ElyMa_006795800 [Elysia marginata]|uniref:Uncharacterized protein n=1 Tax=Elysia marginata TaxID=1093978 RepID=A0AAV4J0W7_9GAST|nr:hypothetical protein ElyMa_006795800 [Elysia marginata]
MVANTLGIEERTLINWIIKKNEESKESVPVVARSGLSEPVGEEDRNFLIHWLNIIPTVPFHYCRKQKSYEGVKFLFPGKSMRELHKDYLESCRESQTRRRAVKAFHAQKLSVFIPRKDQCDVCISAKLGHITNEMHERHTERKPAAQQEKEKNKTESDTQTSVWTMDLQSVLTCPKTQASAMYESGSISNESDLPVCKCATFGSHFIYENDHQLASFRTK